jgi:hypothetical protein
MPSKRPSKPDPEEARPRRKRRPKAGAKARPRAVVEGLIGVGLDAKDGHTRITKAANVLLLGGSEETHERMQEFTIRLGERMKAKGKRFGAVSAKELRDLADGL